MIIETIYEPNTFLTYSLLLLALTSILTSFFRGRWASAIALLSATIASSMMFVVALDTLLHNTVITLEYRIPFFRGVGLPTALDRIVLRIDPISAYFVLVLSIVTFTSSLYGISYVKRFVNREHLGIYNINYNLFILSMYMTIMVYDIFWFIVFWEIMTLASQFLVSFEKEKPRAVYAGYKYFCVSKLGAEAILVFAVALLVMLAGMNTGYDAISRVLRRLMESDQVMFNVAMIPFIMGLCIKAALVPFHNWLPDAHPEAPCNVSALLSGFMIKVPVYMIVRIFYTFIDPIWYWGLALATLGTLSLAFGTMYALVQTDSKRLLAYHSVGQIGYITLALGSSIYLYSLGPSYRIYAIIAFAASLYHLFNHAMFKSLLFLTAGSVVYRTGSRDLNGLGGLGRFMPITSFSAFTASMSISGIPPFNGFVSKWMIYLATIPTGTILSIYGAIALFISAVTASSFVKYYSTIFTGVARRAYEDIKEVPPLMTIPQILLAIICICSGILPVVPLYIIRIVGLASIGIDLFSYVTIYPFIVTAGAVGVCSPLLIFVITYMLSMILLAIAGRPYVLEIWSCGMRIEPRLMYFQGRSYYMVFERIYYEVYGLGSWAKDVVGSSVMKGYLRFAEVASRTLEEAPHLTTLLIALILAILGVCYVLYGVF